MKYNEEKRSKQVKYLQKIISKKMENNYDNLDK